MKKMSYRCDWLCLFKLEMADTFQWYKPWRCTTNLDTFSPGSQWHCFTGETLWPLTSSAQVQEQNSVPRHPGYILGTHWLHLVPANKVLYSSAPEQAHRAWGCSKLSWLMLLPCQGWEQDSQVGSSSIQLPCKAKSIRQAFCNPLSLFSLFPNSS